MPLKLQIESAGILREGPCDGSRFAKVPPGTHGLKVPFLVPNPEPGADNPIEYDYEFTGFDTVDGERLAIFTFAGTLPGRNL